MITTAAMAADEAKKEAGETIQGMVEQGNKGSTVIKTDDGQTFIVLGQNMARA